MDTAMVLETTTTTTVPVQSYQEAGPRRRWPAWCKTSTSLLKSTEDKILARIKNKVCARFVTLPNQDRIWTLTITDEKTPEPAETNKTPLVMVHGLGGGVGQWVRNLDALSRGRPVHAFDVLGFGQSSRPPFPADAALAEERFVDAMELWRQSMGLETMILLGHSMGGYLATSYAIQHPSRVSSLILVDPWGFLERVEPAGAQIRDITRAQGATWPRLVQAAMPVLMPILMPVLCLFNPLAAIRAAGPWGPVLVNRFRPDVGRRFEDIFDDDTMTQYLYHCNAQTPSGEVGFRAMSDSVVWAKRPMLERVHQLPPVMPVTMLHGAQSWVDRASGDLVARARQQSPTTVLLVEHAAHNVYADRPEEFNRLVEDVCNCVD